MAHPSSPRPLCPRWQDVLHVLSPFSQRQNRKRSTSTRKSTGHIPLFFRLDSKLKLRCSICRTDARPNPVFFLKRADSKLRQEQYAHVREVQEQLFNLVGAQGARINQLETTVRIQGGAPLPSYSLHTHCMRLHELPYSRAHPIGCHVLLLADSTPSRLCEFGPRARTSHNQYVYTLSFTPHACLHRFQR